MSSEFVTVAVFTDTVAAALARNCLEEQGIRAFLLDEMTVGTDWALSQAVGGIKLQVHQENAVRADALLHQLSPVSIQEESADGAFADPKTAAELRADQQAEQEDETPKNQAVDRLLRTTIGGLLFFPIQFYALWLLMGLNLVEGTISRNRRWKVWAAVLLNLPLWSACLIPTALVASRYGSPWQGPAWQKRHFPEDGFSVRLPGPLGFQVNHIATRYGEVEMASHFANANDVNYQVSVFRYPKATAAIEAAQLLDEEVPEIITSWGATAPEHRNIQAKGRAGQEWSAEAFVPGEKQQAGRHILFRARFFVEGNRVYVVLAEWSRDNPPPPRLVPFLDSFTLK